MRSVYLSILLLYCALVQGQKHESHKTHENIFSTTKSTPKLSYGGFLENALRSGNWESEDLPCLSRLYKTIEDARNNTLYAVWMLDSMQMIPNGQLYGSALHLTNYDECLDSHWKKTHPTLNTQYCLAEVKLSESYKRKGYIPNPEESTDVYLKVRTPEDMDLTIMKWGLCLPATCPKTSATKIFRVLLQASHLGSMADEAKINIDSCKIAGEEKINDEPHILGYLMTSLFAIAVWSTYYTRNNKLDPKSYIHEIIRSFCLKRNLDALTTVRDDDELYVVNFMRIFSCLLVVTGHCIQLIMTRMTVSGLLMDRMFGESGAIQRHGNLVVDTFFTLSGMLVVRNFMSGSWSNPIKFLIKRYVRLFGVLGLLLYVKTYVLYSLGDGPLWEQTIGVDQKICQTHLWETFATLNNYFGMERMCYLISWSTSADYHFSIIAVIICMIYARNQRRGIFAFIVIFLAALIIPTYVTYIHKLPVIFNYGLESGANLRDNIVFHKIYRYTHTRAGPFLVGMIMGYILANFRPAQYRKRISRKASYIYLIACLAIMNIIIELGGTYYYRNPEAAGFAVFGGINRTVHAAMICVIIAIAEYGDLGLLSDFFKASPFVPLGRLTYGVYLVHYVIVERNTSFARTGYTTNMIDFFIMSTGVAAISFGLSFILSLLVEGPAVNVVSVLLDGPRGLRTRGKADLEVPTGNDYVTNSNGNVINSKGDVSNSNGHIRTVSNGIGISHRKDE